MNYIGSKFKLSSWIQNEVKKVVGNDLREPLKIPFRHYFINCP